MLRTKLCFSIALALLLCAQHALAAPTEYFWNNASGGDYATPGNWTPSGPPSPADDAIFDLGSSGYDVDIATSTQARQLIVRNDNINISVSANVYSLVDTNDLSTNSLVVGDQAAQIGELTVKLGTVEAYNSVIANAAGSQGTLTVDGSAGPATLTNHGELTIGRYGAGTLNVNAGGTASSDGHVRIGQFTGSTGNLNIDGASSTFEATTFLVGNGGDGTVTVQNGGHLAPISVTIGAGGVGQMTVKGTGSSLTSSTNLLEVGNSGSGTLTVENGATASANVIALATNDGSSGAITVTGAGSKLSATTNTQLVIGGRGHATFEVLDGATFTHATQDVILGQYTNSSGTVVVDGAGSLFSTKASHVYVGGYIVTSVGLDGNGSLTVSNGATFTAQGTVHVSHLGVVDVQGGTLNPGTSVVNDGVVHLNGTLNGNFINDGLLTGGGTINGTLRLDDDSIVSPGNSPGTLNVEDTDWYGGGTFKFEINSALGTVGVNWDLLNITGGLDLIATANDFVIDLTSLLPDGNPGALADFDPSQDYAWTFAKTTSGITGFAPENFTVSTNHFSNSFTNHFSVRQVGNELQLLYSVPEPSTIVSGAIGLALVLGAVHRRRRMRNR